MAAWSSCHCEQTAGWYRTVSGAVDALTVEWVCRHRLLSPSSVTRSPVTVREWEWWLECGVERWSESQLPSHSPPQALPAAATALLLCVVSYHVCVLCVCCYALWCPAAARTVCVRSMCVWCGMYSSPPMGATASGQQRGLAPSLQLHSPCHARFVVERLSEASERRRGHVQYNARVGTNRPTSQCSIEHSSSIHRLCTNNTNTRSHACRIGIEPDYQLVSSFSLTR